MKKRSKKDVMMATLDCLHIIHSEIQRDPLVQCTPIVESFCLNGALVDDLKRLQIISETEDGKFWVGDEPNMNMVMAVRELRRQYRNQYNIRKKSPMFTKQIAMGYKKGKNKPEPTQSKLHWHIHSESNIDWEKKVREIEPKEIKHFDQSMVSEFIEHHDESTQRIFEFRLFGFKIFSIKY